MDVREDAGGGEEGGDVFVAEAGDAAADAGHEEGQFRMAVGELDEVLDITVDDRQREVHRRDGVTLALQADALAEDRAETLTSGSRGATQMEACLIAAEYEDLPGLQRQNVPRSDSRQGLLLREDIDALTR